MTEIVRWEGHTTVFGDPVLGSPRSIAWLQYIWETVGHFQVIQSAFHTGFGPSAGTHDRDACYDLTRIDGMDWRETEHALRAHAGGAWYRFPPSFSEHVHVVVLGYVDPWESPYLCGCVGVFIPGQVVDYYNHALGLVDQHDPGDDPTWHPDNINATIAEFERWRKGQHDMDLNDQIPGTNDTVGDALRAVFRTEERVIRGNTLLRSTAADVNDIEAALATMRANVAGRDADTAQQIDKVLARVQAVRQKLNESEPTP